MSISTKDIGPDGWEQAIICPNPACHRLLARAHDFELVRGCIEFCCWNDHCAARSILGGPDRETPARPHVLFVTSLDAYAESRERAKAHVARTRRASGR